MQHVACSRFGAGAQSNAAPMALETAAETSRCQFGKRRPGDETHGVLFEPTTLCPQGNWASEMQVHGGRLAADGSSAEWEGIQLRIRETAISLSLSEDKAAKINA